MVGAVVQFPLLPPRFFHLQKRNKMSKSSRKAKRGERRENRREKIGTLKDKVKGAAKKVGDKVKDATIGAVFLPLKPFMGIIKKNLGYDSSDKVSTEDLLREFYDKNVRKSKSDYGLEYDRYGDEPQLSSNTSAFSDGENFDPVTISAIVTGIISYFKKLKAKKAAGEPLTGNEAKVVEAGEEIGQSVDDMKVEEINSTVGESLIKYLPYIIVAIILIAIAFYFATKSK